MPADALQYWSWERYGFNTWTEGWQVETNGSYEGATGVSQSTDMIFSLLNGAYALRVDLDLRTNPVSHAQGRVVADMQEFFPYSAAVPMNLSNQPIFIAFEWPATTTMGSPTNRYRFFAVDYSNRYEYFDWTYISTGGIRIEGPLWTITATNAGAEPGFDPCKVTKMGMDFGIAPGSTGVYSGPVFLETIRFGIPPGAYASPANERYSFSSDNEGFTYQTYVDAMACTSVAWVASAPSNGTGCLAVDMHLDGTNASYDAGEIYVDMRFDAPARVGIPVDLKGKRVSVSVYCPPGLDAGESNPNYVRLFCKDENWKSFYGSLQHIRNTGYWFSVSMTPDTNMPVYGWMDAGFDPTRIHMIGLAIAAGGSSTAKYDGKLYVDGLSFQADLDEINTNELRYGFEPNKEGWVYETYTGITGITSVAQSTNYAIEGSNSLRLNVNIVNSGTNRQQGAAKVDMRFYPPPIVRTPFDLDGKTVNAYLYCPAGSQSTNAATPNLARIYVNDGDWNSQYGEYKVMKDGQWIKLTMTVTTNGAFGSTNIIGVGVDISMIGVFTGSLYLDEVEFPASAPAAITNSQHEYDFEAESQLAWWKWDANPEGWHAKAWTNVYYATNWGSGGSVALAADAVFALGVDEVVTNGSSVTTNLDVMRKAVFEIAYQPALNLSTKDHRRIQAKLKFVPPVEGLLSFDASLNVFDKVTDQWYFRDYKVGGMDWNILEFDLDDAADYSTNSPAGPMNASAIGFLNIQIYANAGWTGTVYLEDVIVGGRETGTNYQPMASGFARAAGPKFVLNGSNFYFCGANMEYLQTESDATVKQCLDWAVTNHLQLVRTWAMQEGKPYSFQPQRGVWNELMFEHMDRVIAEAGHRNIRLMLGLLDNWAHNGGIFQYVHWVVKEHPETVNTNLDKEGVEYHDQFWTNTYCRQWYRDYVTRLLNRTNSITGVMYKNDPTIFGFEIVNEPRCESDFSGRTIHEWLNTMSDFVRSIDTNHILGNGEEGGYVSTYDAADEVPWEVYPDNYYHYATYATGVSTCNLYGCGRGHGVDFISDNRSESTYVEWQGGFYTNREPVSGEWRAGNSNINFATCRIYVDQKEYNIWRTNLNSSDQRIEWVNDHWYDAHNTFGKPMILDEFGIHAIGWIFNGSYGQVQLVRTPSYTQQDRVNIFDMYYRHIENTGIPGSFFWNFGFSNMWNDPFHKCEVVAPWYPNTWDGSATGIVLSTDHVVQGTNSLAMYFNVPSPAANKAIFVCPTQDMWILRVDNNSTNEPPTRGVNRVKFFWNFYNPSNTITAALALRGTTSNIWAESPQVTLTQGWTRVMFDLSAGDWAWEGNGWQNSSYLISITNDTGTNVLEDVRSVNIAFYGLPLGEGRVYVDDIQIKRDDGFVVYADDPVCDVIKAHADRMALRNTTTNTVGNTAPAISGLTLIADAFRATNFVMQATDVDGDFLSYRLVQKPTNGWVFGSPPSNLVYKSKPGTTGGDTFTWKAHDGKADSAEAVVTVTLGSTDTDGDSLPDDWEFGFFPKRVQYWPYESDNLTNLWSGWDWDNDGFSDWSEYRAGTDPTNSGSLLYCMGSGSGASPFVITWPSVAGHDYEIARSTNLLGSASFTGIASNITATAPMNTYTDTTVGAATRFFYRIRVQ